MSNAQIIEVVQAHIDGKRIQIRKMGSHQGFRDGKWYDVENPRWDFDSCDYRIAPELRKPREWQIFLVGGHIVGQSTFTGDQPTEQVLVREVIE